ncbi:MAG: hypothetical protein KDF95_04930 [Rhodocyclaceae bacterium]|nr:hypothetical protein [Rhodocyclaceae bacterium]
MKNSIGSAKKIAIGIMALGFSQAALSESNLNISGWVNEGMVYYDDGVDSDTFQTTDNGTTLNSRITFSASADVPNTSMKAGMEIILEPNQSSETPLLFSSQSASGGSGAGDTIGTLGKSIYLEGSWGKVTMGLQSMPTDNIAVLADPSGTLWTQISPLFRFNGFTIQGLGAGATNTVWGSFAQCLATPGLGIGIDCNGIYRKGFRYDLPQLAEGLNIAVGFANDEIYDIAAKYTTDMSGLKVMLHGGYAINVGNGGANVGGSQSETFQIQVGVMDTGTGLFGTLAYQNESADDAAANSGDDTDAYHLKFGIKKKWIDLGDTAISVQYASYKDQFGMGGGGITGSDLTRSGVALNQNFGPSLVVYLTYEKLSLDVDCNSAACSAAYDGAKDLDSVILGGTFFF